MCGVLEAIEIISAAHFQRLFLINNLYAAHFEMDGSVERRLNYRMERFLILISLIFHTCYIRAQ